MWRWDVILLRNRDFHKDAKRCIENLDPPLQVLGKENIPQHGPCVITVNHYHRDGFGAQWIALAIAALVPVNMHWIMTGEFTYPGKWYETDWIHRLTNFAEADCIHLSFYDNALRCRRVIKMWKRGPHPFGQCWNMCEA